jgi:hypothetical protein
MEKTIRTASNTTAALWEDQMTMFEQLLSCCQDTRRDADLLLKKVEGTRIDIAFQDEQRTEALHSHFQQQKDFLQKVLALSCPSNKPKVSNAETSCAATANFFQVLQTSMQNVQIALQYWYHITTACFFGLAFRIVFSNK